MRRKKKVITAVYVNTYIRDHVAWLATDDRRR